jgi:hypothetical protein
LWAKNLGIRVISRPLAAGDMVKVEPNAPMAPPSSVYEKTRPTCQATLNIEESEEHHGHAGELEKISLEHAGSEARSHRK